jgi:T1SS-143 domain-containing protein
LRFTLDPDSGSITFFLAQPLDHQNPDATGAADTIEFSFDVEVTFIDGTSQTKQVQATILDAGPTATTTSNAVDEASELGAAVAGNLAIVPGADGLQSVALDDVTATSGGSVIALTSGGEAVLAPVLVTANTFQGKTASGQVVYQIVFDPATGDYSFTLIAPLDHPDAGADTITLTFDLPVTDGDGDTVISTIVVQVADDVVIAQADNGGTVAETTVAPVEGNVTDNDDFGVDGFGEVTQFVHGGVVYTPDADGVITIATALGGSFTFDFNTGAYSYVAPDSVDNSAGDPLETFTYTVADGDGDTSTTTLTIAVSDANAPTADPDALAIDEAVGDSDAADPFNAFTPIVRLGNLTDNDDPGGDGFGSVRITGASYDVQGLGSATQSEDADSITFTGDGWTLEIDKLTGDYTFTQTGAIDHNALSSVPSSATPSRIWTARPAAPALRSPSPTTASPLPTTTAARSRKARPRRFRAACSTTTTPAPTASAGSSSSPTTARPIPWPRPRCSRASSPWSAR